VISALHSAILRAPPQISQFWLTGWCSGQCSGQCSAPAMGLPRASRLSVHVTAQGPDQAECQGQGDPQQGGSRDLGAVTGPLVV
jgi:hypothetical protein